MTPDRSVAALTGSQVANHLRRAVTAIVMAYLVNWSVNSLIGWESSLRLGGSTIVLWFQNKAMHPASGWDYFPALQVAPYVAFIIAAYAATAAKRHAVLVVGLTALFFVAFGLLVNQKFYGLPDTPRYVVVYVSRVVLVFVGGPWLARLAARELDAHLPFASASAPGRRGGFTLTEVLVVVAIIAVLAAIIFPVFARAKKSANITADLSQMRQVYVALKLYEEDSGSFPPYLTHLVPRYIPKEILHGVGDPRGRRADGTYPAAASCVPYFDGADACPRSPYMVSYPYLLTFRKRLVDQNVSLEDLLARPEVGLIASIHHTELTTGPDFPQADPSEGKIYDSGIFLRTRMDGATKIMHVNHWGEVQGCAWEYCFLQ